MSQISEGSVTISRRALLGLAGGAAAFTSTRSFALVGGTIRLRGAAQAQQTTTAATEIDWQPVFFDRSEALAVARLSETILPRTDTAGAIDADVPTYIDLVVSLESESLRKRFRERLQALQLRCRRDHSGRDLSEVTSEDLTALLTSISDDVDGGADEDRELRAFFRELKRHTVVGYYTSLEGRTQELGLPARVQRVQWQGCSDAADHRLAG